MDDRRDAGSLIVRRSLPLQFLLAAFGALATRARRPAARALTLEQTARHRSERTNRALPPALRPGFHLFNPPYTAPATCRPTTSARAPGFASKLPPSIRAVSPPAAKPG